MAPTPATIQSDTMLQGRLLGVLLALVGCGSADSTSSAASDGGLPADPLQAISSDSGKLRIEIRTGPQQPPSRGNQTVEFVVVDAMTGAPEPGLMLDVIPWMPAMGHGTSLTPSVSETAPGTYVITNVGLFMPGTWELRTSIAGTVTDHAAPSFQIP